MLGLTHAGLLVSSVHKLQRQTANTGDDKEILANDVSAQVQESTTVVQLWAEMPKKINVVINWWKCITKKRWFTFGVYIHVAMCMTCLCVNGIKI